MEDGSFVRKRYGLEDQENDTSIQYANAKNEDQQSATVDFNIVSGNSFATSSLPVRILFKFSQFLSQLWWLCLDSFIALFIRTTEEQEVFDRTVIILNKISVFFKGGFFAISLLLLSPFAIFSFLIWLPLQLCRPRSYSYYSATADSDERRQLLFTDITPYQQISVTKDVANTSLQRTRKDVATTSFIKKSYVLVTGNVCLMPEFLARLNNVRNSVKRAEKISQLLCGNQPQSTKCQNYANQNPAKLGKLLDTEMLVKTSSQTSVTTSSFGSKFESESCHEDEVISLDTNSESSFQWSVCSKEKAVCETFPRSSDFLCLQEVFDRRAENALLKGLKARYPYILYDAITPLHHGRISMLNSGLCIASKYPFLDVQFKPFPDGYREDKYACKGILMTKIFLGENEGKTSVGYLATTHLQAITHTKASEVRCKQLNLIQQWLDSFKDRTKNKNHTVVFDIICGDFNFDQESHFEEGERKCEFRRIYRDPCMDERGQQRNWVIGTELIAQYIHENAVNSSRGLQRMLVSELERPRYVASTRPANCTMTKMSDGRRRIDYILYKPCGNKKMVVKDYKFITGFATLTDHIPLSMAFSVDDE